VRAGGVIIGALYHPPRASYSTHLLLNYIESCIEELTLDFPVAPVVLAGDFNQIPDCDVESRTGMEQLVRQPTRGPNLLDRIFVSSHTYNVVRVILESFEYFCQISSKSIHIISSYTVSKLGPFFETQCINWHP